MSTEAERSGEPSKDALSSASGRKREGEGALGPAREHRVEIRIAPRAGLLDPEGKAIQHALESLEFDGIADVRVGRLLRLTLRADSPQAAREAADAMCTKLLANPVTENYEINILPERDGDG